MMLWHIGNTTVRTPYRLREALRALLDSPLNGNLSGPAQETAFAVHLHKKGIVSAPRVATGENFSDLGRKWRVALSQLGFVTPQLTRHIPSGAVDPALAPLVKDIIGLSGRPFEVTPNGQRLATAEVITAQQECFLRSLASYAIPSPLEQRYPGPRFSPLRFILNVMRAFEEQGQTSVLSFQEFSLFIQTASPADHVTNIADKVLQFRNGRIAASGNVRSYDRVFYSQIAGALNRKEQTLDDYADLSFRYLKATGLFRNAGRGITITPAGAQLAGLLRQKPEPKTGDADYFRSLWLGADLPTDEPVSAYKVVTDLAAKLNLRGAETVPPLAATPLPQLNQLRLEMQSRLAQLDEAEYASQQTGSLAEILSWIQAIITRKSVSVAGGETLNVPKGEYPAYLEWAIWRGFLAIDSLKNAPWDARRFQIDQDFLPVSCAPGGGPDMVFEFDNMIIVVEVTLTASSRQEAAEGEPVRRHVARFVEDSKKPVYGLFIAGQIDSNTAHTFRSGDWYRVDDTKMTLDIVPITLLDFKTFLASALGRIESMPKILRQMLVECRAKANLDAPQWKSSISGIIKQIATQ